MSLKRLPIKTVVQVAVSLLLASCSIPEQPKLNSISTNQSNTSQTTTNSNGEAFSAGGNQYDGGYSVAVDNSGNTFISGSFEGTAIFGNSTINASRFDDSFLSKYDPSGQLLWIKTQLGGLALDKEGNAYALSNGSQSSSSAIYSEDFFINKLNQSGDQTWASKINCSGALFIKGIKVDNIGNLFIVGSFTNTLTLANTIFVSKGEYDIFLLKYNTDSGELISAKSFGGDGNEEASSLSVTNSGDLFITGGFLNTASIDGNVLNSRGGVDAMVLKLNTYGDVQWIKQIGGINWDDTRGVANDESGNCYVTGYFSDNVTLGTATLTAVQNEDVFVVKYNSTGDVVWAKSAGGMDYEEGQSIAVDKSGYVYVTGFFEYQAIFGNEVIKSQGPGPDRDIFVSKFSNSGEMLWTKHTGSSNDDYGYSLTLGKSDDIYVTGSFGGLCTFGVTQLSSHGLTDVYLWKIPQGDTAY